MDNLRLLTVRLALFDGDGGGSEGNAGGQGETQASPAPTRREKETVLYGKQEAGSPEADAEAPEPAEDTAEPAPTSNTLEDRRKAFRNLVTGEYKDLYTEDVQRIIDRRFRESQEQKQQLDQYRPIIDMLSQRYNIRGGDVQGLAKAIENDNAYWSEAADEAGMTVDQYKAFQKLQRENANLLRMQREAQAQSQAQQQLRQWYSEGEKVKETYPSFDLSAEAKNPQFLQMLKAGVPVQHAYEVIHMEDIKAGIASLQAQATEKKVVEGIRARGTRPAENGTTSQSGFVVKDDVHKLTKEDRAEIAKRVMRGETISF